MGAAEILVIFLSVALAIFLTLSIVLTVYLIKLVQKAEKVADTVQESADTFVTISDELHSAIAPAVIARTVGDIADRFMRRHSKRDGDEEDK